MKAAPPPDGADIIIARCAACICLAFLACVMLFASRGRLPLLAAPARQAVAVTRVDVNSATPAQLALLPGIGPALAERIVNDRAANGGFEDVDALDRVPGIGPAVIERLRGAAVAR